jgi:galactose-1-phosphate uridylyltransferase
MALEPRGGIPIVYSETRAQRLCIPEHVCVVCDEQTCPVVDQIELPCDDIAWFTPNLYPITYPHQQPGAESRGVHLVHWSSLRHSGGLIGSSRATASAILQHLARAEEFLLHNAPSDFPDRGEGHRGHVAIVKNRGRLVGGSVPHDHQQIMLSAALPAEPPRIKGLAQRLLTETPEALIVECVDDAATTLVPPFMRRPLQTFIVPNTSEVGWIHHMEPRVLEAMAVALARLTASTDAVMTEQLKEPAWNLILHTGPGLVPLIEMRPFTQALGGYEHLGLYLCEELPATSAGRLRDAMVPMPSADPSTD